jgi:RND family efflux transporter MFP subunit
MTSNAFPRVVLIALLGLSVALSGCSHSAGPVATAPTPVQVSYPVEQEIFEYSDATGRTAAVDSVDIRARVFGYLDKVNFKEGVLVKKGDVLFEIDPRTYKAALTQAEGNLASAQAKADRLESDLKRADSLILTKTISREEYDKISGDRKEAVASILALKGAVDQAKLDLDFTKVRAPVDGRVGRAIVTVGNLVQSGQTGGTLLTTLVSVDPMYVYYDVDERTVLRVREMIRAGKAKSARDVVWPVFVGLANEEGYPHEGTIDFVDNQVNPKTGTLRLRAVLPNKNEVLSPGYFARVRVPIGSPYKALLVNERVIDTDQGQKVVYLVNDQNKVVTRPVKLGIPSNGLRAIAEGLSSSDRVIVDGFQSVRPGMVVEPTVVAMPRSPVK